MQFIRTEAWDEAVAAVAGRLIQELKTGKFVLWLISGGSQIPSNTEIMRQIPDKLSQKLSIMPVDERYGPPGHADSNWAQLMQSGFQPKQAKLLPVLEAKLDFAATAERFNNLAGQAFADNQIVIGQLGLGADGHTAGILPASPACDDQTNLVAYYEAPPFKRLTLTFAALRKINVAYVLAFGENKLGALQNLKQNLPLNQQPSQIVKDIAEAYIYNDQLGESHE
jgi:6-phosphogluconolactonase/glucosamine-6-phosphate isomerase/deaminase